MIHLDYTNSNFRKYQHHKYIQCSIISRKFSKNIILSKPNDVRRIHYPYEIRRPHIYSLPVESNQTPGYSFTTEEQTNGVEDEAPKTALDGQSIKIGGRRSKLVLFTCNKCGGRSARNVNPLAWQKGVVFGQCQHCQVWHVLSANNKKVFEEIRYKDVEGQNAKESVVTTNSESNSVSVT